MAGGNMELTIIDQLLFCMFDRPADGNRCSMPLELGAIGRQLFGRAIWLKSDLRRQYRLCVRAIG